MKTEKEKLVNLIEKFLKATERVPMEAKYCNVSRVSRIQKKLEKRIQKIKSKKVV